MIAAASPLLFCPNPTRFSPSRIRLPFRSPELCASRTKMEFLLRLRRLRGGAELTAVPDAGGEDTFADAVANPPEHLVIMVNGINGSSEDWIYAAEQFVQKLPDKVLVHRSQCNYLKLTFDGVDTVGERLIDEVREVVEKHVYLKKISFIAHSFGGLVSRYAIGKLFTCDSDSEASDRNGKIAGLEPINFITVATPHLGSRGNKQLPFLFGLPFLERKASEAAHLIVGRSGKHLFLTDSDKEEPLLLRMVKDSDDIKFMSALRVFKRRVAYANANYDYVVGWRTSSIRRQSELPELNRFEFDRKYPHILYLEQGHSGEVHSTEASNEGDPQDELEEKMIRGLTQVDWERVDVSFQKSRQRFVAHNTIQVKRYWLNSEGAHVVKHIIDNFLL